MLAHNVHLKKILDEAGNFFVDNGRYAHYHRVVGRFVRQRGGAGLRSVLIVARKAKGMKVKEAAHKLGISSSFYYKIERFFGSPS